MPSSTPTSQPPTTPVTMPIGTTGTGLDALIDIITGDAGLLRKAGDVDVAAGATAANALNGLLVQAIRATGVANDGRLTVADLYAVNGWIRAEALEAWTLQHGDDADAAETGFHRVQADGARSRLFGANAVDTVADGLYHLGFEICDGVLLNEDGMPNVRLVKVADWLGQLLAADLAGTTLDNPAVDPLVHGSTGTGLDAIVELIGADAGLQRKIALADIQGGARAADGLNVILVEAIRGTGVANDGDLSRADLRDVNAWIRAQRLEAWTALHGDDHDDGSETGFHLVQNDGASTKLAGRNAVDTVADGIYHLGFEICGNRVLNEDGNANASLAALSGWLTQLLAADLAAGTLDNPGLDTEARGTTGTGLDRLVDIITADVGLDARIATSDIVAGARAADAMNGLIVDAIRATRAADGGAIDVDEVREINAWLRQNHLEHWAQLHGDDEDGSETGFHRVQDDGARSQLFGRNAVDTVADGLFHLGFEIQGQRLLNEDGAPNARLLVVSEWLNGLLADDLAAGTLLGPVALVGVVDGSGL